MLKDIATLIGNANLIKDYQKSLVDNLEILLQLAKCKTKDERYHIGDAKEFYVGDLNRLLEAITNEAKMIYDSENWIKQSEAQTQLKKLREVLNNID